MDIKDRTMASATSLNATSKATKTLHSLESVDDAMDNALAATLSASVYTDNVWSIQTLSQPLEDMPVWRALNVPQNDPGQLARAILVKDVYAPTAGLKLAPSGAEPDPITVLATDWMFLNNVFYAGDLACASTLERKRLDGTTVVELCFRGTEKSTTGDPATDRRNLVGGFFLSAYKDLEGHYERHRPLVDAVVQAVNQRRAAGEAVELHVSGHSLGGSMAEMFAKKDANKLSDPSHLKIRTFGSPGIGQSQSAFSMVVMGFVRLIKTSLGLMSDDARKSSPFASHGEEGHPKSGQQDILQFIDPDDPVPKLGLLGGYAPSGLVRLSRKAERDPYTGEMTKGSLLDTQWHSMAMYEKSRLFSFMHEAMRTQQSKPTGTEAIAQALLLFKSAKSRAAQFVSSTEKYLDNPELDPDLGVRIARVVSEAKIGKGMIPSAAPNSRFDVTQMDAGVQKAGATLLGKLTTRRTEGLGDMAREREIREALASIAAMSSPRGVG